MAIDRVVPGICTYAGIRRHTLRACMYSGHELIESDRSTLCSHLCQLSRCSCQAVADDTAHDSMTCTCAVNAAVNYAYECVPPSCASGDTAACICRAATAGGRAASSRIGGRSCVPPRQNRSQWPARAPPCVHHCGKLRPGGQVWVPGNSTALAVLARGLAHGGDAFRQDTSACVPSSPDLVAERVSYA